MNASRRKKIKEASALIKKALQTLEEVRDEEQSSFDNLPEGLQESTKGAEMEENISELDEMIDNLEDAFLSIESFI